MNISLNTLAKSILVLSQSGLPKVKFAKIIYFLHKYLIEEDYAGFRDIAYIRMPLGPVPKGFMEIDTEDWIITENKPMKNGFPTIIFKGKNIKHNKHLESKIKSYVSLLESLPTDLLVMFSHQDPTWKKLQNGKEFYISKDDLAASKPYKMKKKVINRDRELQALFFDGLLNDIVEETMKLEYPETNNGLLS